MHRPAAAARPRIPSHPQRAFVPRIRAVQSPVHNRRLCGGDLADESAGVHDQCMDIAYISALSALAGSVVGGLKLVELFDQYGVSFVSITQSFNTTSSMGRLTLNVLLSLCPVRA